MDLTSAPPLYFATERVRQRGFGRGGGSMRAMRKSGGHFCGSGPDHCTFLRLPTEQVRQGGGGVSAVGEGGTEPCITCLQSVGGAAIGTQSPTSAVSVSVFICARALTLADTSTMRNQLNSQPQQCMCVSLCIPVSLNVSRMGHRQTQASVSTHIVLPCLKSKFFDSTSEHQMLHRCNHVVDCCGAGWWEAAGLW